MTRKGRKAGREKYLIIRTKEIVRLLILPAIVSPSINASTHFRHRQATLFFQEIIKLFPSNLFILHFHI